MKEFRDIGLKLTPQRLAILQYLKDTSEHPSAEDIYRSLRVRFPTMSFATVYNTLAALVRRGSVLELKIDPLRKRYDPCMASHHHFSCSSCGRIYDVTEDVSLTLPERIREDFEVTGIQIEFVGVCSACRDASG